jgi:hypothetical protein
MTRALAVLLAAFALLLPTVPAQAQVQAGSQAGARVLVTVRWVEEWDPVAQRWVRIADMPAAIQDASFATATATIARSTAQAITEAAVAEPVRFIARPDQPAPLAAGLAQFGPFRVLDERRAALVAGTDAGSPAAFQAMLAAYPGIEVIEFRDAPGTSHDIANLRLGRMIRAAGLETYVPAGGSARSGAVELFLAGTRRRIDPGALFAVHAWRDQRGREPADFAADAPENRIYLDYYTEMGMSEAEARAFYALTNSVPHQSALWLTGSDMARWIARDATPRHRAIAALPRPVLHIAVPSLGAMRERLRAAFALALTRTQPTPAPRLAYAELGPDPITLPPRLLDSGHAFP